MTKRIDSKSLDKMDGVTEVLPLLIDKTSSDLRRSLETIVVNTEMLLDHSTNIIEKRLLQMVMDAAVKMESKITDFHELGNSIRVPSGCFD